MEVAFDEKVPDKARRWNNACWELVDGPLQGPKYDGETNLAEATALGKISPQDLIRIIDDSHVPLAEEEQAFSLIREKVKLGQRLTEEEEDFLHLVVNKAKEWQEGIQRSAETEPEHTFAG